MSRRNGTFEEFKDYTVAVVRGERTVDPSEPKVWFEAAMRPLRNYSIGDLEETRRRIAETENWVKRKSDLLPGPGWDHIKARLKGDREAVEAEISCRIPP